MGGSPSLASTGAGNDRGNPNANTILPGLLDRSLGVTELKGQQTGEPTDAHRPARREGGYKELATDQEMAMPAGPGEG
jgi:hypothetical protein